MTDSESAAIHDVNNGYRMTTFWDGRDSDTWPPSRTVLDYYVTLQREYGA